MTKPKLTFLAFILSILLTNSVQAIDARVETTDGEVFTIIDFSMEGRQRFSVDYKGATTTLDWKNIASFEVKQVGSNLWVEVHLLDGKKEVFGVRQVSPFRGRSDFGKWSLPFEKVKKVFLIGDTVQDIKKEEPSIKELSITSSPTQKEVDKITMRNGDILLGNILNETVSIKTSYGTLSFKKEDILRISLGTSGRGQKEKESDILYSKYGDKLTGVISDLQIKITLLTKINLPLFREHLKEIEFGVMPEVEQKVPREKSIESPPPKSPD